MLPAAHRLTDAASFRDAARRGRRAAGRTLVVHLLAGRADARPAAGGAELPPRAGFVVSKAVGGAVVRTRVKRRLRHLVAARLGDLRPGTVLVVRALPPAATAGSVELGADLARCLDRLLEPVGDRRTPGVVGS